MGRNSLVPDNLRMKPLLNPTLAALLGAVIGAIGLYGWMLFAAGGDEIGPFGVMIVTVFAVGIGGFFGMLLGLAVWFGLAAWKKHRYLSKSSEDK